ncbi:MAG: hypothetical protein NC311_14500 [Muribaculaceae bacterium]|nr:hypothetical protein [Muribaculaceae bacterium]
MRLVPIFYKIVAEIVYNFALNGQSYICDRKNGSVCDVPQHFAAEKANSRKLSAVSLRRRTAAITSPIVAAVETVCMRQGCGKDCGDVDAAKSGAICICARYGAIRQSAIVECFQFVL